MGYYIGGLRYLHWGSPLPLHYSDVWAEPSGISVLATCIPAWHIMLRIAPWDRFPPRVSYHTQLLPWSASVYVRLCTCPCLAAKAAPHGNSSNMLCALFL